MQIVVELKFIKEVVDNTSGTWLQMTPTTPGCEQFISVYTLYSAKSVKATHKMVKLTDSDSIHRHRLVGECRTNIN